MLQQGDHQSTNTSHMTIGSRIEEHIGKSAMEPNLEAQPMNKVLQQSGNYSTKPPTGTKIVLHKGEIKASESSFCFAPTEVITEISNDMEKLCGIN